MAGTSIKKRSFNDGAKGKGQRPTKKQRQAAAYHSSSEEEESEDDHGNDKGVPLPAGLFDSDDDLENMLADDGASSAEGSASGNSSQSEGERKSAKKPKKLVKSTKSKPEETRESKKPAKKTKARDVPQSSADEDEDSDAEMDSDDEDDPFKTEANRISTKSKRNDPEAFAVSISKMLSSKLPVSKRADPIVARSVESAAASKQVLDAALEAKARKRLREQKRLAMEKGRVRDVLMPTTTRTLNIATGEVEEQIDDGAENTSQIMATERRLRKVAQRGVVKLFNAVRAAQVKATEAQRAAKQEGIVGSKRREEKVTEMSRQGFLDLIASGGGALKKGGVEEEET